jgi:N-methylhydantoinase B
MTIARPAPESISTSRTAEVLENEGAQQRQWDVVGLAVLTNRLEGIVRKMTNTLFRTARTSVLNTARDFSCCIVTREHMLLVMAEALPIHTMSGPDLISRAMASFHPLLRPGDAFLHNSPYHGNSHAGDHCIVVPVIDDVGVHQATVIVKAHMADIGNSEPTTLMATARDVYHEGALIFPCVKVQANYENIDDIIRICQSRIRVPEDWYGDFLAMLGAARIGERELLSAAQEFGWDAFHRYTVDWFDYSEQRMSAAIRALPAGRITTRNAHDPLPLPGVENGVALEVTVDVKPAEALIEVDLRNNPDCVPCGINLTESTSITAAMIGIFNSIDHTIPRNGGSARRLRILLRENCCAGIPVHPASCATATSGIAERVAGLVQVAMAELGEGFGMAETGAECPPAVAGLSGRDPRHGGAPFVDMMILGNSAGAGHARGDGWLTNGEVGDGGMMMRDSTEVIELLHPIRIWNDQILPDTEGAGRFRSAPSLYVEYGPVDTHLEVMYAADGRINPALGARGGHSGGTLWPYRRTRTGQLEELDMSGHVFLDSGETIISISPAGGGYGPPIEREPGRVVHDVLEGWISRERAAAIYGVIMDDAGNIDNEATAARRRELAEAPSFEVASIGQRVPRPLSAAAVSVLNSGGDAWSRDPAKSSG